MQGADHSYFLIVEQQEDGSLIPPTIPLSSEHVSDEGIYLLENGEDVLIYIGGLASSSTMQQLFGFSSIAEVPAQVFCFNVIFRCMVKT